MLWIFRNRQHRPNRAMNKRLWMDAHLATFGYVSFVVVAHDCLEVGSHFFRHWSVQWSSGSSSQSSSNSNTELPNFTNDCCLLVHSKCLKFICTWLVFDFLAAAATAFGGLQCFYDGFMWQVRFFRFFLCDFFELLKICLHIDFQLTVGMRADLSEMHHQKAISLG